MFGVDNLMDMLFDSAMENLSRNERVIQLLKRLKLDPDHPPADFAGVYQYALVEYGVGKPRPALEIFRQSEIQQLFREALEQNNPAKLLQHGEAFLADHPLQAELQASNIDVRREFYAFAAVFIEVAKRTRTPAAILAEQKLESLHRQIATVQERLSRLPTMEGLRTEMARLATTSSLSLPAGESFWAEQCKAFALAQQMRGWFETLGFRFETHEVWQDDYFEWIINIPVRRGRYDRILVRGIDGEAGLRDVEALKQSVEAHRTDEGWLVTARRISRAARDEVEKAENDGLGCYTLDELLDQDADFSGYLTWLESEIQKRGIAEKYVPLACLKEEIDPDTQQRIGVSRYDDRDGWIEGYIDLWLDDPAKEHISVLGEFGTGKTWFALHYAWKALQRYREAQRRGLERPRLPLIIPLRDYAKAVSVESLFSEFFFRKHEIPIPGYSTFEQLNRMGKLLLIFDGFDEMAARVDRQEMINNFWELAKVVVPGAKVILTCRTEHFPEAKEGRALLNAELQASTRELTGETPQFEVLELEKFNDEQIRQVLSHQAQPATVEQIMGNPQLLDLARRPVLTELILEALPDIEAGKPVDMSRVYLYAVRHKMERDIKEERTFTSMADKLYFMCELSWEMLSTDRMSINYREFPDRIRKLFGPVVQEEKDLDHWHYDMMGQTMLIRNAAGDYTPAHRSLLEFFVAYKFTAELGVLGEDFLSLIHNRSNFEEESHQNFTWSSYFQYRKRRPCTVKFFRPENLKHSRETFGKYSLTKAVSDLMISILNSCPEAKLSLLETLYLLRGKPENEVGYLGGNLANLLIQNDNFIFRDKNLSSLTLLNVDFSEANLSNTNLRGANLSGSVFANNLTGIWAIQVLADGKSLVSGDESGIITVWDIANWNQSSTFQYNSTGIKSISFNPTQPELFVCNSEDGEVKVWSLKTKKYIKCFHGHEGEIACVAFSPDGKLLASAGEDRLIKIWEYENTKCVHVFNGHVADIKSIVFHPSGACLASGSEDGQVRIWCLSSGACLKILNNCSNQIPGSICFTPDGQHLIAGNSKYEIYTWNIESGERIQLIGKHSDLIRSLTFDHARHVLATAGRDYLIKIWDYKLGKHLKTLSGHTNWVNQTTFLKNGEIIASASNDSSIRVWEVKTGKCIQKKQGHPCWIRSVTFDSSGKTILSGSGDSCIRLWDLKTGKCLKVLRGHTNDATSVTFNIDNSQVLSGSGDHDIRLWDIQSGTCIRVMKGHSGWVHSVAINETCGLIASGGGDFNIKIWDVETGSQLKTLKGHQYWVSSVAFLKKTNLLASGSADRTIKLWDFKKGTLIGELKGHEDAVFSIDVSPDNSYLASGSEDGTVRIWNINNRNCIKILEGHSHGINSVSFSHDNKLLASGSRDKKIRIWDIESLKCLFILEGHIGSIESVIFSADGTLLASSSWDGRIKVWDIRSRKCIKTFIDRVYEGMNITNTSGLSPVNKVVLKSLGAVDFS